MKLLMVLFLISPTVAFADAYYKCASQIGWAASVEPKGAAEGNHFSITLPPNMPLVKALGLPTTQSYVLNGVYDECEHTNPKAAHASYCYMMKSSQIKVIGLTDGAQPTLNTTGMSVKATDSVEQTPWTERALVKVQLIFDLPDHTSVKGEMGFAVRMPGAPVGTPSECD